MTESAVVRSVKALSGRSVLANIPLLLLFGANLRPQTSIRLLLAVGEMKIFRLTERDVRGGDEDK